MNAKVQILLEVQAELARVNRGKVYPKQIETLNWLKNLVTVCNSDEAAIRIAASAYHIYGAMFQNCQFISQTSRRESLIICPAYPKTNKKVQSQLTMGKKPTEILGGLTAKEAHHSLSLGISEPIRYLLKDHLRNLGSHIHTVRSTDIARWLKKRWDENEIIDLTRIDEIEAVDLTHGEDTTVRIAFRNSQERTAQYDYKSGYPDINGDNTLHEPPHWWKSVRCAILLNTKNLLVKEGKELRHCVGSYSWRITSGESVLIALDVPYRERFAKNRITERKRSTVEFNSEGKLIQHRAFANQIPHPIVIKCLNFYMKKRWRINR